MDAQVKRFIANIPQEYRPLFDKLQAIILGLYPDAEIKISYGVPTYKAKAGWVSLGYRKDGVTLYTNGPRHLDPITSKYPQIKTGKGSLKFTLQDSVPVTALKKVIKHAIEHPLENN